MTEAELITAVARAFWEGGNFQPREPWSALEHSSREGLERRAVAAIEVMRSSEPPEAGK